MTTGSVIFSPNGAPDSSTYSYSTRPRVVPSRKRFSCLNLMYFSEEYPVCYGNLMYDRRVVRGNTYALQSLPWCPTETDPVEIQKQREAHRKMLARKRSKEESEIHAPQVEVPHLRTDVQTELYLEEIADRIIEVDMECQTDAFLQRPDTPLFVPAKTGADVATQIEEGELFDFDIEVRPIVEVLVGKTVEQALLEVTEEEELANLQAHQFGYHELRNAELAEVQRLEQQETRRKEEKERRKAQQVKTNTKSAEVKQRISSRAFSLQYLSNLIPSVFNDLHNKGFFFDIIERDIEKDFLPYVMGSAVKRMASNQLGRIMTDSKLIEISF
ncbi:radial spoke head protein 3 homolog [Lacerta agilis]|uniref:radial spoke head protein 3 homolog n=1 Tax=Lacerta agilis TaxID=80427 RepID=UPI0014197C7F|nr:radial spoke head protein 3 homolog [Lacerta agilis]